MNYAELIATAITRATGAPDSFIPQAKEVVLKAAIDSGHKLEDTDLLDEIPEGKARRYR